MKKLLAGFLLLLGATSAVAQQATPEPPSTAVSAANREPEVPLRTWQGIPGLERTPKGRVFVSWFTGGPKEPAPENTVLLCYSDDGGATFTLPQAMGVVGVDFFERQCGRAADGEPAVPIVDGVHEVDDSISAKNDLLQASIERLDRFM